MGKGDKKTKRGKIVMGSFGVRRSRKKKAAAAVVLKVQEPRPKKVKEEKVKVVEPLIDTPIPQVVEEHAPVKKPVKKAAKTTGEPVEGAEVKPKTPKTKKKPVEPAPGEPEPPVES